MLFYAPQKHLAGPGPTKTIKFLADEAIPHPSFFLHTKWARKRAQTKFQAKQGGGEHKPIFQGIMDSLTNATERRIRDFH